MCRSCFESFIRFGGTKTFNLNLRYQSVLEANQNDSGQEASVQSWLDRIWHQTFGSTAQAILKTKPFEFSAAGLSDLDKDGLKEEAVFVVQAAIDREGFNLVSPSGQQRALAVLTGFLNQEQQTATQIFLPNLKATDVYRKVFMLSEREYMLIKTTDPGSRYFLVKQGNDAIVAKIDLSDMDEVVNILSGRAETVLILDEVRKEFGNEPEVWMPMFHKRLKERVE